MPSHCHVFITLGIFYYYYYFLMEILFLSPGINTSIWIKQMHNRPQQQPGSQRGGKRLRFLRHVVLLFPLNLKDDSRGGDRGRFLCGGTTQVPEMLSFASPLKLPHYLGYTLGMVSFSKQLIFKKNFLRFIFFNVKSL